MEFIKTKNINILDGGCENGNFIRNILKKKTVKYLEDFDYSPAFIKSIKLKKINNFSSTYYFCSTMLNVCFSKLKNRKAKNSDFLSKIGWDIKSITQNFSQTKIY